MRKVAVYSDPGKHGQIKQYQFYIERLPTKSERRCKYLEKIISIL